MAYAPGRPAHRVRSKSSHEYLQGTLPAPLDLDGDLGKEGTAETKRMAYLVTLPHPRQPTASTGEQLVAPSKKTKEQIWNCFLDACANPVYVNQAFAGGNVQLEMGEVFREFHQADAQGVRETHDHLPVLAKQSFRYLPVKRALLQRHGLASHWSVSHDGHWSCVRYCYMSSPKKPLKSLDRNPYLWPNTHPPLEDCCYERVTAGALRARRNKIVQQATEAGEAEPRFSDLGVWALVVRAGIKNTPDDRTAHLQLAAYAKQHCGEAMVHYLWRRRSRLPQMIDDIWQWENVEQMVEVTRRSRMDGLRAAADSPCVCQGHWRNFVTSALVQHGINIPELCHDTLRALMNGRCETTPVIVLAGRSGGEGKSVVYKPLHEVYEGEGLVFGFPDKGNFSLIDLPFAKVVLLDEFRLDGSSVSWSTLDLWFEGSAVPIGRPQNVPGQTGHMNYKGTAPIFVTTKLEDIERLAYWAQINPTTNAPWDTEASMLLRRLKVYPFNVRVPKPRHQIRFCKCCFARLVLTQARLFRG